ncbi:MAG: DUF2318 domain-containing protein [Nitrospirae bacterium]|nr:DUF2318 domain-containing protein [Nitrospirota bacterium]
MKYHSIPLIVLTLLLLLTACSKKPNLYQEVQARENRIVIPLSEVSDGKVHFYTYRKSGKHINFFIRTDGKGTVSSYYDACFTCYKKLKGYRQEGSDLVCNECNMKFGIAEEKWDEKDGCNPINLKSAIENNSLVIETAVIEKGAKLF